MQKLITPFVKCSEIRIYFKNLTLKKENEICGSVILLNIYRYLNNYIQRNKVLY